MVHARLRLTLLVLFVLLLALGGCSGSELNRNDPVTLSLWHVYGEQADSPMNRLADEFNDTVGLEKGIIINVTAMSNASRIGSMLLEAQAGAGGAPEMPDLFFAHLSNALELGTENLLDWNTCFSATELAAYVPAFLQDGTADGRLCVFPVTKSTHLLFIAGGQFARFSADTGVTRESLDNWDGFFDAAAAYYDWSGGKPFCSLDYPLRAVELAALEAGAGDLFAENGFYNFSDPIFKATFLRFAEALARGHIVLSDL